LASVCIVNIEISRTFKVIHALLELLQQAIFTQQEHSMDGAWGVLQERCCDPGLRYEHPFPPASPRFHATAGAGTGGVSVRS
jgi:hypothetical protein